MSATETKSVKAELLKKYTPVRISRNRGTNDRNINISKNHKQNSSQNSSQKTNKLSNKINNVDELAAALGILILIQN